MPGKSLLTGLPGTIQSLSKCLHKPNFFVFTSGYEQSGDVSPVSRSATVQSRIGPCAEVTLFQCLFEGMPLMKIAVPEDRTGWRQTDSHEWSEELPFPRMKFAGYCAGKCDTITGTSPGEIIDTSIDGRTRSGTGSGSALLFFVK